MSSRKPFYAGGVIFCAIVFSAPIVLAAIAIAREGIQTRRWPLPPIPGFAQKVYHNPVSQLPIWQNQFVHLGDVRSNADGKFFRNLVLIDPETGDSKILDQTRIGLGPIRIFVFGDRL